MLFCGATHSDLYEKLTGEVSLIVCLCDVENMLEKGDPHSYLLNRARTSLS